MNETPHTPGKWAVFSCPEGFEIRSVNEPDVAPICRIESPDHLPEDEANAHRIANLHNANNRMDMAVGFELALKQLISEYQKQGLTVTNAVGTLALIQMEISTAFITNVGLQIQGN